MVSQQLPRLILAAAIDAGRTVTSRERSPAGVPYTRWCGGYSFAPAPGAAIGCAACAADVARRERR